MKHKFRCRGFSLLELLVAMSVATLLIVAVMGLISSSFGIWNQLSRGKDAFAEARTAFDDMTRLLARATLNVYWGYEMDNQGRPVSYGRASELHFALGDGEIIPPTGQRVPNTSSIVFQAPLGLMDETANRNLAGLLNAAGFFIAYGPDPETGGIPSLAGSTRNRFRLYRWLEPSEGMSIYGSTSGRPEAESFDWINPSSGSIRPVANNILALFVAAQLDGENSSSHDSRGDIHRQRHQLPSSLKIVLIAMDETSASALGNSDAPPLEIPASILANSAELEQRAQEFCDQLARPSAGRPPLRCKVFAAEIPLVGARWSGS